ncbi:MAG: hypothetical protein K2X87_29195 [Gemmataceae bacterium]|nr:hypothetical protein [Gemmataceae bacterium]
MLAAIRAATTQGELNDLAERARRLCDREPGALDVLAPALTRRREEIEPGYWANW